MTSQYDAEIRMIHLKLVSFHFHFHGLISPHHTSRAATEPSVQLRISDCNPAKGGTLKMQVWFVWFIRLPACTDCLNDIHDEQEVVC